jgi:hypothetical protein
MNAQAGAHVSVVIVNWNGKHYLKPCLDSVLHQSHEPYDVYVVDNASTDGSTEFVRQNYAAEIKSGKLKLVQSEKNRGIAEGNNVGIRLALKNPNAKYVATLNADTIVKEDWLEQLLKAAEKDGEIGMCQGKILLIDKKKIDSTGWLFYRSATWWDRGEGETDSGQYDSKREIFGVCSAAALFKREMLEDVAIDGEYFDSDFFGYVDDTDLSVRGRLRGWSSVYEPNAVVYHHRGGTTGASSKFVIYQTGRNDLLMIFRTVPTKFIIKNLPLILLSQTGEVYVHKKHLPLILKAKLDAALMFKKMWAKRRKFLGKGVKLDLNDATEKRLLPPVSAVPSWL